MAQLMFNLRVFCAVAFGIALCASTQLHAQETASLAAKVTTRSLFGADANGSVSDLMANRPVGSLFGTGQGANVGSFFDNLTDEQQKSIIDRAYPNTNAKWDDTTLFVCWEDMEDEFAADRALVRDAVNDSWAAASALSFVGWGACQESSVGIRIAVRDIGPHVVKLGKDMDGVKNGMVLNFTYKVWEPGCRRSEKIRQFCTRTTAVHEFGHAIGFSHEQNRPDTPGDCAKKARPQGEDGNNTDLTPWDPHSVMNYCNVQYLNNGALSVFDKQAVQEIYGNTG